MQNIPDLCQSHISSDSSVNQAREFQVEVRRGKEKNVKAPF